LDRPYLKKADAVVKPKKPKPNLRPVWPDDDKAKATTTTTTASTTELHSLFDCTETMYEEYEDNHFLTAKVKEELDNFLIGRTKK
jgi:hypothetical protein